MTGSASLYRRRDLKIRFFQFFVSLSTESHNVYFPNKYEENALNVTATAGDQNLLELIRHFRNQARGWL